MDEQFLNICRGVLNVVTDSHILCLHTGMYYQVFSLTPDL